MMWYQVAFEPHAPHGTQWVVLQMWRYGPSGLDRTSQVYSRWPTRHEAEDHARTVWEKLK